MSSVRGPKKLYRVSWSGGTGSYKEANCQYYSLYDYAKARYEVAIEAGAKVHFEMTECGWTVLFDTWSN